MAIIECDGAPAQDKWLALRPTRIEPFVTLRCPHGWTITLYLDGLWEHHQALFVANVWNRLQRNCRACALLDPMPGIERLLTLGYGQAEIPVYRSTDELTPCPRPVDVSLMSDPPGTRFICACELRHDVVRGAA